MLDVCLVYVRLILLVSLSVVGCQEELVLPEQRLQQYPVEFGSSRAGDTLHLSISPNNRSPIKSWVRVRDELVLETSIAPMQSLDTSLVIDLESWQVQDVRLSAGFDGIQKMDSVTIYLPWPPGRRYKVVQGYDGSFSHQSDFSRYALDFDLAVGDTVTAADDGFVVGLVVAYSQGGNDRRLRDYANFITLFHPGTGVYTQYVHIEENGSLVSLGDQVFANQPIGLSGNVGYTSTPHLHFNILGQAENEDLKSIPVFFGEGLSGFKLRPGLAISRIKE